MSDVTDLLDQMIAGDVDVDDVAKQFRDRDWPTRPAPQSEDFEDAAAKEMSDAEPQPEGSFAEVVAYFNRGKLDLSTYGTLATAAAESINARLQQPGTAAVAPSHDDEEHL
jgi:hypothetical protein